MQYLITPTKEEQTSKTSEWIQQPHAVHGQINGLLRETGLHVMACGVILTTHLVGSNSHTDKILLRRISMGDDPSPV